MMANMGLCLFSDGVKSTDLVAPKSSYPTLEAFLTAAMGEWGGYDWDDLIRAENVKESQCRYYPTPPDGAHWDGGSYSFSPPGRGSFPVWRISLEGGKTL